MPYAVHLHCVWLALIIFQRFDVLLCLDCDGSCLFFTCAWLAQLWTNMFFHTLSIHVRCRNDDCVTVVTNAWLAQVGTAMFFDALSIHVHCLISTLFLECAPNVQSVWPGYHVAAVALRRGGMVLATSVSMTPTTNVTEWVVSRVQWIDMLYCSALLCAWSESLPLLFDGWSMVWPANLLSMTNGKTLVFVWYLKTFVLFACWYCRAF